MQRLINNNNNNNYTDIYTQFDVNIKCSMDPSCYTHVRRAEHVQCATASLVTVPVITERLEIIEAVSQPFVVDPSAVIVSSAAVRVIGGDVS